MFDLSSRGFTIREILGVPCYLRAMPAPECHPRRRMQVPADPGALGRAHERAADLRAWGYQDVQVSVPPRQYPVVSYRLLRETGRG